MTDEARARVPALPWEKIVGVRRILVHVYFDLDNDAIWKVATRDLATLADLLNDALGDSGSE